MISRFCEKSGVISKKLSKSVSNFFIFNYKYKLAVANLVKFVQVKYKKINIDDLTILKKIVGKEYLFTDEEKLLEYSRDETEDLSFLPEVIVKPKTTKEVSKILSYCDKNKITVTACGGRTGLSGGSLPIYGGVSLSLERFISIIEIDERNLQATVEPGVITQNFRDSVKKKVLFYPPDTSSKGICQLVLMFRVD